MMDTLNKEEWSHGNSEHFFNWSFVIMRSNKAIMELK